MKHFLEGINYRNASVYNLLTKLKLGYNYNFRYRLAAQYIDQGDSVLDICGGTGDFKSFLPENCDYACIEASPEFVSELKKKNIEHVKTDLHKGLNGNALKRDVVVMIISLCQFRNTSMHDLLEGFKKIGKKVVIVEDVLANKRRKDCIRQKAMDYLCMADYYFPVELFTFEEFRKVMDEHNYQCIQHSRRYSVGIYPAFERNPGFPR